MSRRVSLVVIALAAIVLFGAVGQAYAQSSTVGVSYVSIPFSFKVDNKVMPAGRYELSVTDQGVMTMTPPKGAAIAVPIVTRLAAQKNDPEARLVFDKVENTYILSEAWFPPQDGYMIADTKQPHTHHVIKGEKTRT